MSDKGRVIALGFFDGVHIGHKALLDKVIERSDKMELIPSVINFDIHPDSLVFNKPVDLIYSSRKRTEIIRKEFNIEDIIMIHFDRELMTTPWDVFLKDLISENRLEWIVVGYDFRLGYKGSGTPDRIRQFCEENGLGFDMIPAVEMNGNIVSSSMIRNCIASGDMENANKMLGREFSISGTIVHGRHLGSKIGFPTVNLNMPEGLTVPSFGVYASRTLIKGEMFESITNIGRRPTFYTESEIVLETHIFDVSEDLYGENAEIFFCKKIRSEIKFTDASELSLQISDDIEKVKRFFAKK
jgi:riboflavin kinase/FMN adenylyltransferase